MPRAQAKQQQGKLKEDQLIYLAGLFDGTVGLRSTSSTNAVAISKTEDWPKFMAKTYGGEARLFISNAGKDFWGWFVPLPRRVELFTLLEEANLIQSLNVYERDGVRAKLEKAAGRFESSD